MTMLQDRTSARRKPFAAKSGGSHRSSARRPITPVRHFTL
jgi:hypothetical protein